MFEARAAECTDDQFRAAMYDDPGPRDPNWAAYEDWTEEERALAGRLRRGLEQIGGGRHGAV